MLEARSWQVSDRIGPYRIVRRLGSGGMGVVYLGRHHTTGTAAAVKVIRPEYATDPHFRARLRREVAAARRVPRSCTAPVLDADVDSDPPWLATEYIDAPALDTALLERGRLTGEELAAFAVGTAVALRAIHQHGVVHRDLKPSNVLLSPLGPRVIDFGIAQMEGAETLLTQEFGAMGTPAYMAPEQLRGQPATTATDVFGWASLVCYAATGRPPFGTGQGAVHGILYGPPDLGDLDGPLRDLVTAAFQKDPAARPSAPDLVAELGRIAAATTTQVLAAAASPVGLGPPARRPPSRARWRRPLVATGLAVGLAANLLLLTQSAAEPPRHDPARSRQLAAESLVAGDSNQRLAMELALDAWAAGPTAEARGALLSAYMSPYDGQLGTDTTGVSVAVSPDGTLVAIGRKDGTVQLWSTETRQPVGQPLVSHTKPVQRAVFSPDGTLLATASLDTTADETTDGVRVWDVASGELLRALPGVISVGWLPDGTGLVSVDVDGDTPFLRLWDARDWTELIEIPTGSIPLDVAVSPDGAWVASGHIDGTAAVWRLSDGSQVAEISGHEDHGVMVAFSPDGELASVGAEGEIRLTDPDGDREPRALTSDGGRTIGRLLFTPDGFLLAVGAGADVQVWDAAAGTLSSWLAGFGGTPLDVATSADGKVVAATGDGGPTTLWRRATYWVPHPSGLTDVRFAPTGDHVATSVWDGAVRTFDRQLRLEWVDTHPASAYDLAYAPDGSLASTHVDGTVRIWDPDGRERARVTVAQGLEAQEIAFSPDGSLLAVSAAAPDLTGADGAGRGGGWGIYLWDTGQWRQRAEIELRDFHPYALAFAPDGSHLLAAGGADTTTLAVWRIPDLTGESRMDLGAAPVYTLGVSPDGTLVALAGGDGQVHLRSAKTFEPVRSFGRHPVAVRQLEFAPDGQTVATVTSDDSVVRIWDVATGDLVANLAGHGDEINALAFSPDGRTLATAGSDGYLGLWTTDPDEAVPRICRALGPPLPSTARYSLCR